MPGLESRVISDVRGLCTDARKTILFTPSAPGPTLLAPSPDRSLEFVPKDISIDVIVSPRDIQRDRWTSFYLPFTSVEVMLTFVMGVHVTPMVENRVSM